MNGYRIGERKLSDIRSRIGAKPAIFKPDRRFTGLIVDLLDLPNVAVEHTLSLFHNKAVALPPCQVVVI